MALRDNVFEKFGPLLQESLLKMWLEELNELRVASGKQPLTMDYILGKVHNNLNHLDDYDWMNDV